MTVLPPLALQGTLLSFILPLKHAPPSHLKLRRSPMPAPSNRREIRLAKIATPSTHVAHTNTTSR